MDLLTVQSPVWKDGALEHDTSGPVLIDLGSKWPYVVPRWAVAMIKEGGIDVKEWTD